MGTISFPGLSTGIDTSKIITELMNADSYQLNQYKNDLQSLTNQKTAVTALQSKASALQTATNALADQSTLESFKTNSSDTSVLDVSVNNDAKEGSHTVLINQLATNETWIQDTSNFTHQTDYVGAGNFIYSYNGHERTITTTSTTTLEDFVGLINNDQDNPGVTASLLDQGGTYHLILTGRQTGKDYQISINDTNTEVWKPDDTAANSSFTSNGTAATLDTKITSLDQWSGGLTGDESITISGTDHNGTTILPSRTMTISSETTVQHLIDDLNYYFDGVATARLDNGKIVVTDDTSGTSSLSVNLTYNDSDASASLGLPTLAESTQGGSSSASLTSMASSTFVQTQDAQSAQIKIDNYSPTLTAEVQTVTPDAAASGGTFTLSYKGKTTAAINYNATTADIQSALNALSTVTADGGVTVAGDSMDTSPVGSGFTVTFTTAAGDVPMITANTSGLTGTSSATVSETTRGNDDEWITRNSNVISDALRGITFSLHDVNKLDTSNNSIPVQITINRDTSGVQKKLSSYIKAYNAFQSVLNTDTQYDDQKKTMGLLSDTMSVTMITDQIKNPLVTPVTGFSAASDTYYRVQDIGLKYAADGTLELDSSTFNTAINDNYTNVLNLLSASATGTSSNDTIKFASSSDTYTTPGSYDVKVTVDGSGTVTSAQIKPSDGTTYRDMRIEGDLIHGDSSFDTSLNPVYPENGLYLQVDTGTAGTFTATVNVKQGLFVHMKTIMDNITKTQGQLDLTLQGINNKKDDVNRKIDNENTRLDEKQKILEAKYARLESTISQLQGQLSQVQNTLGVSG